MAPIAVLTDREGLGDVMLKAPFLRALRRAFPDHDVWWIADHQSEMDGDLRAIVGEGVTRVITEAALNGSPGSAWPRLRALPRFSKVFDSRTMGADVALARFGLRHDGFYCCLGGYVLCDGVPPSRARPRHVAERMLSLIHCATGRPADASGRLEASAAACAAARRQLPDARAYVGIALGSRQAIKNWPLDKYLETARAVLGLGSTPVFFLGPFERDAKPAVEALAGAVILESDPRLPRRETLDLLIAQGQRLSLLIANDNGVGHLLGAAGTPVISLFGPTDPARWAPVAPANRILRARDYDRRGDIAAIPVRDVVDAAMAMLDRVGIAPNRSPASLSPQ
ncbi:MAG TPA: glycosyltransferase family 9 protein [Caulobacteraceae bacterium]|nr:glycosyltransferase family 9 protein [Caulobacteraceae bacterium]